MNETIIKNPLTEWVRNSIINSKERLNFAFPFLSSFAKSLLNEQTVCCINDKRIITRFDGDNLNSFDLPTLRYLLDLGFKIQYNNSIHMKLYIADNDMYITSSNFTKEGFEDNVELSVKIDANNNQNCVKIFDEIWTSSSGNILTYELIEKNWAKYEILCKREEYNRKKKDTENIRLLINDVGLDLDKIKNEIFNQKNYSERAQLAFEANKQRERIKKKLMRGFDTLIFYAPEGHELRRENLFYDFVYGYESKLAGTGLREAQFQAVFEHNDFKKVINYICPEIQGLRSWNLSDEDECREFCNGIFDFNIPQYSESLPISLATYFYPHYFIPIYKLDHLNDICETLGVKTKSKSKGDKLCDYNLILADQMRALPFDNYVKSSIAYLLYYTIELYKRLKNGEIYDKILNSYSKNWIKEYVASGKNLLVKLKMIH